MTGESDLEEERKERKREKERLRKQRRGEKESVSFFFLLGNRESV